MVLTLLLSLLLCASGCAASMVAVTLAEPVLQVETYASDCATLGRYCDLGIHDVALRRRRLLADLRRDHGPVVDVFLPRVDFSSTLPNMHPDGWAVNAEVLARFGAAAFTSTHSLLLPDGWPAPQNCPLPFLLGNVRMDSTSPWFGGIRRWHIADGVAVVYLPQAADPNALPVNTTAISLVRQLRLLSQKPRLVALITKHVDVARLVVDIEAAGFGPGDPPVAVVSLSENVIAAETAHVWSVGAAVSTDDLVTLTVDGNGTVGLRSDTAWTPPSVRAADAQYQADLQYLGNMTAAAAAHDPVLATAAARMPAPRAGSLRYCNLGECAMGSMWTDAMRSRQAADVAFLNSGAPRGPGWPVGPVKTSDVFQAVPFQDSICTGTMRGITLLRLLHESVTHASFSATDRNGGLANSMLQVSGLRVRYNPALTGGDRLISVEVLDPAGGYAPLDRRRLYRYASVDYVCHHDDYTDLFEPHLLGEAGPTITEDRFVRGVVARHLMDATPYTPPPEGQRLVNVTETVSPALAELRVDATSCGRREYWNASIASCAACPAGTERAPDRQGCVQAQAASSRLPVIIASAVAGAAVAAGLVAALAVALWCLKGRSRGLRNAPLGGHVAVLFTDVEDSTLYWSFAPQSMAEALTTHHRVMRECIEAHEAYEVKTAGDSFMIACRSATHAVGLAMDIQRALHKAAWPSALGQVERAAERKGSDSIVDDPTDLVTSPGAWNGLRVRIGVHCGPAEVKLDEVTRRYDYYGPPVNVASRIEKICEGGEVRCSDAILDAAAALVAEQRVVVSPLGEHALKGVPDPVPLHRLLPAELADRAASLRYTTVKSARDAPIVPLHYVPDSASPASPRDFSWSSRHRSPGPLPIPGLDERRPMPPARDCATFFIRALRAFRPPERGRVVDLFAAAWHLQPAHDTFGDSLASAGSGTSQPHRPTTFEARIVAALAQRVVAAPMATTPSPDQIPPPQAPHSPQQLAAGGSTSEDEEDEHTPPESSRLTNRSVGTVAAAVPNTASSQPHLTEEDGIAPEQVPAVLVPPMSPHP